MLSHCITYILFLLYKIVNGFLFFRPVLLHCLIVLVHYPWFQNPHNSQFLGTIHYNFNVNYSESNSYLFLNLLYFLFRPGQLLSQLSRWYNQYKSAVHKVDLIMQKSAVILKVFEKSSPIPSAFLEIDAFYHQRILSLRLCFRRYGTNAQWTNYAAPSTWGGWIIEPISPE